MIGTENDDAPIRRMADVEDFARQCFQGTPGDRIGVELEFLVFDRSDPARQVAVEEIERALPPMPGGSTVTFEPGGQVELSGPPGDLPGAVCRMAADVTGMSEALDRAGLTVAGFGLDPLRRPVRQLHQERYEAMARLLGLPYGPLMMCLTASIQVNVDLGRRPAVRWRHANMFGPVLNAAFANSPLLRGRPCGWMSGRQAVWLHLDPTRTRPLPSDADPVATWAAYLAGARLMPGRERRRRPAPPRRTFGDWMRGPRLPRTAPTAADLAYHATTVFPPVRPRGWLEIRYLDALHPRWWPVCVAVTSALLLDDAAADTAAAYAEPLAGHWWQAAHAGLADRRLRGAAEGCFHAAIGALPSLGASPALVAEVEEYAARHVTPGLGPAAELLLRARDLGGPLPGRIFEAAAA
ncbi:ergothioneine biosynthesis glutamate--cysteine ligase EgtA [Sphaerisporangium rubeum]|uniref:Glutamate--cysteine ligase EgtA n=1 Tax=Sphaerisporangium rubeum TaxID=321317 RepID=A0A7X0IF23_9ACTN|nr:glutamate-cysteine ligase family protein [Sphaerisporangium rubeum]MBB6474045.1 glutamate--cysteine ligase [Sphaerisporangium rubeum]